MKTIERTGKTSWIYDAFKANNFAGMTIQEINNITKIPTGDLEFFFKKHNVKNLEKNSPRDKYICKVNVYKIDVYYLLAECR